MPSLLQKAIHVLKHAKLTPRGIELRTKHESNIRQKQYKAIARLRGEVGSKYARLLKQKLSNRKKHRLNYDHILIVTYGRSGSTLLQGVLNTIDGVTIRGENDNVFYEFFKAYQKLINQRKLHNDAVLPNQAWFGISFVNPAQVLKEFRRMARKILLGEFDYQTNRGMCVGFKEIRYSDNLQEFEEYLGFLQLLFPNTAIIFNTRNIDDVLKSGWWQDQTRADSTKQLEAIEAKYHSYHQENNNTFKIKYEQVKENGEMLQKLFSFLGADYKSSEVETVLAIRHSYLPNQNNVKQLYAPPRKSKMGH